MRAAAAFTGPISCALIGPLVSSPWPIRRRHRGSYDTPVLVENLGLALAVRGRVTIQSCTSSAVAFRNTSGSFPVCLAHSCRLSLLFSPLLSLMFGAPPAGINHNNHDTQEERRSLCGADKRHLYAG